MPDDHSLRAILYGPIVLAGDLGRNGLTEALVHGPEGPELSKAPALPIPEFSPGEKRLHEWIKPGDRPLTFRTEGQRVDVSLHPFYQLNRERYSLYWKVT
jgi:hypothetical protein